MCHLPFYWVDVFAHDTKAMVGKAVASNCTSVNCICHCRILRAIKLKSQFHLKNNLDKPVNINFLTSAYMITYPLNATM